MILTFALFPALERVALTDTPTPGEPTKPMRVSTYAGGPGLRAATVIRLLGGVPQAIGFVGGRIGDLLKDALDKQQISYTMTTTASQTRGGFLLLDKDKGIVTVIPEAAPTVTEAEMEKLLASLSNPLAASSYLLLSGGNDNDATALVQAADQARAASIPIIADVKGDGLKSLLEAGGLFVLRVSHKTLQRYSETSLLHDSAIVREARHVQETHNVANIVVTLGEEGALLVNAQGAWRARAPVVSHFNPTGGGQTLVGAMAVTMETNGGDVIDALRYGCTAASINVTHDEPGYATPAEVAVLLSKTIAAPVNLR